MTEGKLSKDELDEVANSFICKDVCAKDDPCGKHKLLVHITALQGENKNYKEAHTVFRRAHREMKVLLQEQSDEVKRYKDLYEQLLHQCDECETLKERDDEIKRLRLEKSSVIKHAADAEGANDALKQKVEELEYKLENAEANIELELKYGQDLQAHLDRALEDLQDIQDTHYCEDDVCAVCVVMRRQKEQALESPREGERPCKHDECKGEYCMYTGTNPNKKKACSDCKGSTHINCTNPDCLGYADPCPKCKGTGEARDDERGGEQ